ncbi:MAG: 4-alpha-glucanotransferase [Clostridia bacterium]
MTERKAGVLMHITSLPGRFGIGTFGREAYDFIDFLYEAGQTAWQILPLNPLGDGFSPYQSPSVFKISPLMLDMDELVKKGYIKACELPPEISVARVDYEYVTREFSRVAALVAARARDCIQDELMSQWLRLRAYAGERGIEIIGDMPIYVAPGSDDVVRDASLFLVDENGYPTDVAGCPPDAFCDAGQMWNNPLYNWDAMRADGFRWWIKRMHHAMQLFDRVRLDHFRGFEAYWAIPRDALSAREGRWVKGPGAQLFSAMRAELGDLPIIAEDLGYITPEVEQLRHAAMAPGMAVLQFAFDAPDSPYLPCNIKHDCVVYTGTHDNNTTLGWAHDCPYEKTRGIMDYIGAKDISDMPIQMIRAAYNSAAQLAVVPIQDFLGLSSDARMNTPSTPGGNWRFRVSEEMLTPALAEMMKRESIAVGR